jgi:ribosomal protein S18 acetylase RimI-like enzyme
MLELARGLSCDDLRAIAELERRALDVDGGRLKLEWEVLKARSGEQVEDVLWWEDDQLRGFLGLYAFGESAVEIAGMVDPCARRRGIATALWQAARPICGARGYAQVLLVTPRGSAAGRQFAASVGGTLEHSEHALVLLDAPADGRADPRIHLRAATSDDKPDLSRLLTAAFGSPPSDLVSQLRQGSGRTLVVEHQDVVVGTVRFSRDDETAGVYGFAVDPDWRGRGIGRDALRRVCRDLRADGVRRIGLEVAVENDNALRLYTSLGFTPVTIEDYYALPLS